MIFGLALMGCGFGFLADYQQLSIYIIKHLLLYFGIGVICMIVELIWEIKVGFKLTLKLLSKILILPLKVIHRKQKLKKIEKKVSIGAPLSDREIIIGK